MRAIVAANGGESALRECHAGLSRLLVERPAAVVIDSVAGAADETYRALVESLV